MVSDARKQELMREGAEEMRSFWKDEVPHNLAAAIDDIRVKVLEEGWYGSQLYNMSDGLEKDMREQLYGVDREAEQRDAAHADKQRQIEIDHERD